jgi:hypothetical protein
MHTTILSFPKRLLLVAAMALAAPAIAIPASADTPSDDPQAIIAAYRDDKDNNVAAVFNQSDYSFQTEGSVDIDVDKGKTVDNVNIAYSQSQCMQCSSMTVGFQLVLYDEKATNVSPENGAFSVNIQCTDCFTYSRAIQYVLPVEHPNEVAKDIEWQAKHLNRELDSVLYQASTGSISTGDAMMRIESLATDFTAMAQAVADGQTPEEHGHDQHDDRQEGGD